MGVRSGTVKCRRSSNAIAIACLLNPTPTCAGAQLLRSRKRKPQAGCTPAVRSIRTIHTASATAARARVVISAPTASSRARDDIDMAQATEKSAGGFDGGAYLSRIADRERPWPADSAFLLPLRPAPTAPESKSTNKPFTMPKPLSKGELQQLKDAYYESVKAAATQTFSEFGPDSITEVVPNKAYVFGPILSKQESEDIVARGQAHGLTASKLGEGAGPRTSLRTNDFMCEPISILMNERIPEEVLALIESSPPYTCVRGMHPNWRVAKYTAGTAFAAHIDNSDQLSVQKGEEVGKLLSSHTLLIGLADQSAFAGGATRFFPHGSYEHNTVDVFLPQGYAIVFEQKGLLHAGLEVHEGEKYIAQAGLLRAQSDRRFAPAVFKVGLGLDA